MPINSHILSHVIISFWIKYFFFFSLFSAKSIRLLDYLRCLLFSIASKKSKKGGRLFLKLLLKLGLSSRMIPRGRTWHVCYVLLVTTICP